MNIADIKTMIRGNYSITKKTKNRKTNKIGVITVRRSFNLSQTLAQLANAKTKSQVSAIESMVRAQMQSMKKQKGSEKAIRQMKGVIAKANMKRKALTKEQQLENNRKVAKSVKNKKQEEKFKGELRRKRSSRVRKETVDALNSIDVFDKEKGDTYTLESPNAQQSNSINVACDSFEVSSLVSGGSEYSSMIDTLL